MGDRFREAGSGRQTIRDVHEMGNRAGAISGAAAGPGALAFGDANVAMAQLQRYTIDLKHLVQERSAMLGQIEQAHLHSLKLLSRAAEYHDSETGTHMERVGAMAELMTRLLGCSDKEVRMMRVAAPMHDIGKIAMPEAVLRKAGEYTPEERRIMANHTIAGAEILGKSDIPVFRMAADVALTHHECWDGSGYPARLRGGKIPRSGRIVGLIDFFDALTMERVYRPAFSDERALHMLCAEKGRKFDPELVDVFQTHVDQFLHLRDDVNAAAREYGAILRPDAAELAVDMGY